MIDHSPINGGGQFRPVTNPAGTLLATARRLMPSDPPVNLANPEQDYCTVIKYNKTDIPVMTAIAMGILKRTGSVLTENFAMNQGRPGTPGDYDAPVLFPY